jgi:histidine decarboxylase
MPGIFGAKKTKDAARILRSAASPYALYCEGFGNNDSKGCYINTPLIAAGTARLKGSYDRSLVLEQIQAFDTAQAEGAYIGQINLIQVSSFCGPNGLIWGHDIMESPKRPINPDEVPRNTMGVPVYDADSLFAASASLFGTAKRRRFPIIPGSLVPAAYKTISEIGPTILYGGLGIGIASDKASSASLFMEYVGSSKAVADEDVAAERINISGQLLTSVVEVGENHDLEFEMIYVGTRALVVPQGSMGCILVAIPYVTLAANALPRDVLECPTCPDIGQWETQVSHLFYYQVHSSD